MSATCEYCNKKIYWRKNKIGKYDPVNPHDLSLHRCLDERLQQSENTSCCESCDDEECKHIPIRVNRNGRTEIHCLKCGRFLRLSKKLTNIIRRKR